MRLRNSRPHKKQKTRPPSGDSNIPEEQSDGLIEEATDIDPTPEECAPEPESNSALAEHSIVADQVIPAEGAAQPPAAPAIKEEEG